jgi:hypothetical protein
MYNYSISESNPEGINWLTGLYHVKEFSDEEFEAMSRAAFKSGYSKLKSDGRYFSITTCNTDEAIRYMCEEYGFVREGTDTYVTGFDLGMFDKEMEDYINLLRLT